MGGLCQASTKHLSVGDGRKKNTALNKYQWILVQEKLRASRYRRLIEMSGKKIVLLFAHIQRKNFKLTPPNYGLLFQLLFIGKRHECVTFATCLNMQMQSNETIGEGGG